MLFLTDLLTTTAGLRPSCHYTGVERPLPSSTPFLSHLLHREQPLDYSRTIIHAYMCIIVTDLRRRRCHAYTQILKTHTQDYNSRHKLRDSNNNNRQLAFILSFSLSLYGTKPTNNQRLRRPSQTLGQDATLLLINEYSPSRTPRLETGRSCLFP